MRALFIFMYLYIFDKLLKKGKPCYQELQILKAL